MQQQGFFITGTDTGVGKTTVAIALLHWLNRQHYKTTALKPIESGCHRSQGQLYGQDSLALQQTCNVGLDYDQVNPIRLETAIAPHIAASEQNIHLSVQYLLQSSQPVLQIVSDYLVVEGAGGWQVPLNENETMADFAVALSFPVILVVGLRLGCLNHAYLTLESIKAKGVRCLGWVANILHEDMLALNENLFTLQQQLPIPQLAIVHHKQYLSEIDFALNLLSGV